MVAAPSATIAADVLAFGGFDPEATARAIHEHADFVWLAQRAQKIGQLPEAPSVILERGTIS